VIVDVAALALVMFFTLRGMSLGLVPQVFRIGALVLVWLFIGPLGRFFSFFLRPFGFPGLTGYYLGALIGAVVVFGTLSLVGRCLSERFIDTRTSRMELHSKLGGYLGFITGMLITVLVLFVLGALPEGYLEKKPRLRAQVERSWAVAAANLINPLPRLTFFDDLSAYQRLLRDPQAIERLKEQPAFQKLREHPAVREALADPQVARKLEELDYRSLLSEPKVARLLRDREVRRLLIDLDPRAALESAERALPEAPAEPPVEEKAPEEEAPEGEATPVLEPQPPGPEGDQEPGSEPASREQPPEGNIPLLPEGR